MQSLYQKQIQIEHQTQASRMQQIQAALDDDASRLFLEEIRQSMFNAIPHNEIINRAKLSIIIATNLIHEIVTHQTANITQLINNITEDIKHNLKQECEFDLQLAQKIATESLLIGVADCKYFVKTVTRVQDENGFHMIDQIDRTDAYINKIDKLINKTAITRFEKLPMLVAPRDWVNEKSGGYITVDLPLVARPRSLKQSDPSSLEFKAINYIQSMPYKINTTMIDYTALINYIEPIKPIDKGQSKTAYETYKMATEAKNERKTHALETAINFAEYNEIYLPMYADTRSRKYFHPALSPQADDFSKSFLLWAHGDVINSSNIKKAKRVFALVASSHSGYKKIDKSSINKRVKWWQNEQEHILNDGQYILSCIQRSCRVDVSRLQFLDKEHDHKYQLTALVLDYYQMIESVTNGTDYECCLLMGADAKSSGTQHAACIMRDDETAHKVGIFACNNDIIPDDLYQIVADRLADYMQQDKSPVAKVICKHIAFTRSLAKKPVMTKSYNAGKKAYKGQVNNYLDEHYNETNKAIKQGKVTQDDICKSIVNNLDKAIKHEIKCVQVMKFISKLVESFYNKYGLDKIINYTSHTGFNVFWNKQQTYTNEIKCKIGGKLVQHTFTNFTDRQNAIQLRTTGAPNFIHEHDAALVSLVAIEMQDMKLNYTSQHDELITSVLAYDNMIKASKKSMIALHSQDMISDMITELDLWDELQDDYQELQSKKGLLDLNVIMHAPYFMS